MRNVFHEVIEPSLDRIPILRLIHDERQEGFEFRLTQTVCRNVFTQFDRKLSDHLAVTTGAGFPAFTATATLHELQGERKLHHLDCSYFAAIPQVLKEVSKRTLSQRDPATVAIYRGNDQGSALPAVGQSRQIGTEDLQRLDAALGICRQLGDDAFIAVTGDFDNLIAQPPGGIEPVTIRLRKGTVLVPSLTGPTRAPYEWPIYAFHEHAAANLCVQDYLASIGSAIVAAKEATILAFRAAAERTIHDFHAALGNRVPKGHWRTEAEAILVRLKAGLGEDLSGLSPDARCMALDWCESLDEVELTPAARIAPVPRPKPDGGAKRVRAAG